MVGNAGDAPRDGEARTTDDEHTYANRAIAELYRNPDWGHTAERCEQALYPGTRCGLPAWDGAGSDQPLCEFHSIPKPTDMRERLEAAVQHGADLTSAVLPGASLSGATIPGARLPAADLRGAVLVTADLSRAVLREADLAGADFWRADLSGADLHSATLGDLQVTASDSTYQITKTTDLRYANIRGADLGEARIAPGCRLWGAQFGRRTGGLTEYRVRGDRPDVYRQLRLAIQYAGDYQLAGEFYYWEMRSGREQGQVRWGDLVRGAGAAVRGAWRAAWKARASWHHWSLPFRAWWRLGRVWRRDISTWFGRRLLWFLEKLCGYGEKPWNVFWWAAGTVVVCAILHSLNGLREGPAWEGRTPTWPTTHSVGAALYYSVVTFTTLGYGDITPIAWWGRTVAAGEAGFGAFLMALFLVCIVRRYSR